MESAFLGLQVATALFATACPVHPSLTQLASLTKSVVLHCGRRLKVTSYSAQTVEYRKTVEENGFYSGGMTPCRIAKFIHIPITVFLLLCCVLTHTHYIIWRALWIDRRQVTLHVWHGVHHVVFIPPCWSIVYMLDTVAFPLIEVILRVLFAMDCRFKTLRFPPYIPLLLNFLDEDSQKEETSAEGSGKAKGNIGQGITGHTVWHPEIHGIQQSRALAHSSGTRTYVHLYLIYDLGRSRQIYSVMHALHPTACRMHRSPHCMKDPHASTPLGSFENSACFIWLVSVGWELLSVISLTR